MSANIPSFSDYIVDSPQSSRAAERAAASKVEAKKLKVIFGIVAAIIIILTIVSIILIIKKRKQKSGFCGAPQKPYNHIAAPGACNLVSCAGEL
jgi:hypothetical protein